MPDLLAVNVGLAFLVLFLILFGIFVLPRIFYLITEPGMALGMAMCSLQALVIVFLPLIAGVFLAPVYLVL